jgi:hypothetical protein
MDDIDPLEGARTATLSTHESAPRSKASTSPNTNNTTPHTTDAPVFGGVRLEISHPTPPPHVSQLFLYLWAATKTSLPVAHRVIARREQNDDFSALLIEIGLRCAAPGQYERSRNKSVECDIA